MEFMRFVAIAGGVALLLASLVSASTIDVINVDDSLDSVFLNPIQEPEVITRTVKVPTRSSLMFGVKREYETRTYTERIVNSTLHFPFKRNIERENNGYDYDTDDIYTVAHYDISELIEKAKNAKSINDIYEITKEFNRENGGNCRTSTSAFKIAFVNSPLANQEGDYRLMKAFVLDGYNAHRFIILANKNGNFVVDPYWGMGKKMSDSVLEYTNMFFDDQTSKNYRGIVYKVDVFYN